MSNPKPHSRQKSLKIGKSLAKEESQKSILGLLGSQSPPPMVKQKVKREYTAANSEMETQSKPTSPLRTWNLSTDLSKTSFNVLDKTNETRQRHRSPFYDRTAEDVTYLKLAVKARLNKSKERGDYRNFFNESPPPVPEFNVYRKSSPQRSSPLKKTESNQRSRKNFAAAAAAEEEELSFKYSATVVSPDGKSKNRAKLTSKDRAEVKNPQVSAMKTNNKSTTALHFMSQDTTEHDLSPFSPIPRRDGSGNHMRHSSTGAQLRHSRNGSDARIRHVQSLEVSFSGENHKRYKTTYDNNDDKESSYNRDLSPFRENRPSYDEKMLSPLSKTEKTENLRETVPIVLQKSFKVNRGGSDGNMIFQRGVGDHEVFSPIKFCGDFGDIDESISFLSGGHGRISRNNNSSPGIKNNELKYKIEKIIETKKSRKTPTPVAAIDLSQNGRNTSELKKRKVPKRGGSSNDLSSQKPFSVMQHLMKTLNKTPKLLAEENTTTPQKFNREGVFSPLRLASLAAKKSGSGKDQRSQSKSKANSSNLKKLSKNKSTKDETIMLSKMLRVKNLVEPQMTDFNDVMTLSVDYREGDREASSKVMDDQTPSFDFSQIPKILDDKSIPGESKDGEKSNPREELEEVVKNSDAQPNFERKKKKEIFGTKIKPSIFKTESRSFNNLEGRVASSLESTEPQTTNPNATEEFKSENASSGENIEEEKVKRAARKNPRVEDLRKDSINFSEGASSDRADLKEVWTNIPLDKPLLIKKSCDEGPYDIAILFEDNITRFETFKKFGNVAASIKLLNEITLELETFESKYPEAQANLLSYKIQTRNKLALEFYLSKDYQASLEQSQKVLEIDRCNIQAIYKSFQAFTKLGEKKKAKELLKRIQKLMQIPALVQHNQKFMLDDMSFNSNSNSQSSRRSQSLEDSQDLNTSTISSSEN